MKEKAENVPLRFRQKKLGSSDTETVSKAGNISLKKGIFNKPFESTAIQNHASSMQPFKITHVVVYIWVLDLLSLINLPTPYQPPKIPPRTL